MLDTAAGVWLDRNGLVTSSRGSKGQTENDTSLELMRRCRHAAASVGVRVYTHGGLKGGKDNEQFHEFLFVLKGHSHAFMWRYVSLSYLDRKSVV